MPDRRLHRGPHPEDEQLFAPAAWPSLQAATADLCWLYGRGYAGASSLKLVGDRYALAARQRIAIARCACSADAAAARRARMIAPEMVRGAELWLDGYNVLTSIEAALGSGVILAACDGTFRDLASMHGSYRKVAETVPALERLGRTLADLEPHHCHWLVDRPVSNSGRLRALMLALASQHAWPWTVELVDDPDRVLISPLPDSRLPLTTTSEHAAPDNCLGEGAGVRAVGTGTDAATPVVITADSAILDRCGMWLNLARLVVEREVPTARIVMLDVGCQM